MTAAVAVGLIGAGIVVAALLIAIHMEQADRPPPTHGWLTPPPAG